jgi:hypothetical protein
VTMDPTAALAGAHERPLIDGRTQLPSRCSVL